MHNKFAENVIESLHKKWRKLNCSVVFFVANLFCLEAVGVQTSGLQQRQQRRLQAKPHINNTLITQVSTFYSQGTWPRPSSCYWLVCGLVWSPLIGEVGLLLACRVAKMMQTVENKQIKGTVSEKWILVSLYDLQTESKKIQSV
jgi:hypothetical protein